MNKNRKAKLAQRALAYSNANQTMGADSFSWEDGYRAAMRDMRRLNGPVAQYESDADYAVAARRIFRFLRPLR